MLLPGRATEGFSMAQRLGSRGTAVDDPGVVVLPERAPKPGGNVIGSGGRAERVVRRKPMALETGATKREVLFNCLLMRRE